MPKSTEKGNLARAARSGKLMLSVIVESYESGDTNRMKAALSLLEEFNKDVKAVLLPVISAHAEATAASSNGHVEIPVNA